MYPLSPTTLRTMLNRERILDSGSLGLKEFKIPTESGFAHV